MMLRTKIPLSLLLLSLLILVGCGKKQNSIDAKKAELANLKSQLIDIQTKINSLEKEIADAGNHGNGQNIVYVSTKTIQPETFKRFLDVQGTVVSMKAIMLSPKASGQIIKVNVQEGASVQKGQVLMEIDDVMYQKSLSELETAFDFANTLYEKQKRLWEQKAGSEVQYLQAKNNKEAMEKRIASLKEQISWCKIIAPFAGIVDNISPKIGETVGAGMPIIRLTSMADVKITAEVSEAYISSVKVGEPVIINIPEINQKIDSKFSVISKSIDPKDRTFRIEVHLGQIPPGLRPNLVCSVSINDITLENSKVIPISIIQRAGDKEYVFTAVEENGMKAKKQFITSGTTYQDKALITDGLNFNDKIITDGAFDVADEQPIKIKN